MVITRSGRGTMKREEVDKLTLDQLHAELAKHNMPVNSDRAVCIDTLMSFYERQKERMKHTSEGIASSAILDDVISKPEVEREFSKPTDSGEDTLNLLTKKMDQLVNLIASSPAFNPVVPERASSAVPNLAYNAASAPVGQFTPFSGGAFTPALNLQDMNMPSTVSPPNTTQSSFVLSAALPAQAITLLASQIPTFSGKEEEDIEMWIKKVEYVAYAHGVHDTVKLFAAISKLNKHARDWFDLDTTITPGSWDSFKIGIIRRFRRIIPFNIALRKAEERRWHSHKESFQEYAMIKLKLLHPLQLPQSACINMLICGIDDPSIRSAAATLNLVTIDEFLERMHQIVSACHIPLRRTMPFVHKKEKPREHQDSKGSKESLDPSSRKSSSPKKNRDTICAYCKLRGHVKADCFKLKRKEQSSSYGATAPAPPTSATSTVAAAEEAESPFEPTSTPFMVGCVCERKVRQIQISDSVIQVNSINNLNCNLLALVDSGSPVSFIKDSVCKTLFGQNVEFDESNIKEFCSVNNTRIRVIGRIKLVLLVLISIVTKCSE